MTRVLIFGTGAMACAVGAILARGGRALVTLAGTWREALRAIGERGIVVHDANGSWTAPVAAVALPEVPAADLAIVLVKAPQTEGIAPFARQSAEAGALVVSLQNGLGSLAVLREALGALPLAAGIATLGATVLHPGEVRVFPGEVLLGATGTAVVDDRLASLAVLLSEAGIPARLTPRLENAVWAKLAVNCAINPLAAMTGLTNGGLLKHPRVAALLKDAAREVQAVAAARGTPIDGDPAAQAADVARATAANRSSMLQDIDRGRPTEIEALCGAVVREARRLAVPVPVNEWLWREVKAREAGGTRAQRIPA